MQTLDYYDLLQVSPRADIDTIRRVFRHLAKRLHPDNGESGSAARFQLLMDAFRVLSDPEARARYDASYESTRERRWRIFDQQSAISDVTTDQRIRAGVLALLYTARRNDADNPGMGTLHLEQLLGCPEEHLRFHLWYLKQKGLIQRLDDGLLAITAAGVDHVLEMGAMQADDLRQLTSGPGPSEHAPANGSSNGGGAGATTVRG